MKELIFIHPNFNHLIINFFQFLNIFTNPEIYQN